MRIQLYRGDCVRMLKSRVEDASIHLTVTSPPYDNMRTYNSDALEREHWNWKVFCNLARELYRVTCEGGVVVWVVADAIVDGSESGTSFRQALYFKDEVGFRLHDTMIYQRQARFPESTRYWQNFEYMFVLSRGKPRVFNCLRDVKSKTYGGTIHGTYRDKDGSLSRASNHGQAYREYRARDNVWRYGAGLGNSSDDDRAFEHPAIFPEALARDHILTWSDEGDVVLDPMMGSGTTGRAARKLKRLFVGIEVDKQYFQLARARVRPYKLPKPKPVDLNGFGGEVIGI